MATDRVCHQKTVCEGQSVTLREALCWSVCQVCIFHPQFSLSVLTSHLQFRDYTEHSVLYATMDHIFSARLHLKPVSTPPQEGIEGQQAKIDFEEVDVGKSSSSARGSEEVRRRLQEKQALPGKNSVDPTFPPNELFK